MTRSHTLTPSSEVRIRVSLANGHEMIVGPYTGIEGTMLLAHDLASDHTIESVSVEGKHAWLGWRRMWTRTMAVSR